MGGYSFLARKIAPVQAEKMILTGKIFEAEELHEMGIVDIVAERGKGRDAVYDYIENNSRLHSAQRSIYKVRSRVNTVDYDEMADISDIWVEAALSLSDEDLHRMNRLARAQDRRWAKIKGEGERRNGALHLVSGE